MNPLRDYRLLLAVSAVALGCNVDTGVGGNQAGQGGGAGAGAQGGSGGTAGHGATASAGASAHGRATAAGGSSAASTASGGASTGSAGKTETGGQGAAGGSPGAGTGGSHSESGGAGTGADTGAGGDAGAEASSAGAGGSDASVEREVVSDNGTPGKGACEGKTLGNVIDAIHQGWPELASIEWFYDPTLSGEGDEIFAFRTERGFDVVFFHGMGDCPGGCIDREYKYFETDAQCVPQEVGYYSKTFNDPNCLRVVGKPLWGVPNHTDVDSCGTLPPGLNEPCPTAGCPIGLEPVRFYGIGGMSGPEFCWCSLRCALDPSVCPAGTACTSIADGPSNICSE